LEKIMKRALRKNQHVQHALQTGQFANHGFEDIHFVHNSIPQVNFSDISISTSFGGLSLRSPILINAMTGGSEKTKEINEKLAKMAKEKQLPMAVGSQMSAIKDPSVRSSFQIVRKTNPNGIIIANLGTEASVVQAQQAVDMIEANALQLHLNVMQELIMPEGDRKFSGVLSRIEAIASAVDCPVIIKEVGFGLSASAAEKIVQTGIAALDVGGKGGTNFASIENRRRDIPLDMFNDWGITTVQSLLEVSSLRERINIMASGGIQNGLDAAKAIALGACAVGIAGYFLRLAVNSSYQEALLAIDRLHEQLYVLMTALGTKSISALQQYPFVISGPSYHWAQMRGIDCTTFARRNS
jgi:isopentenyl-diphosphate delta-isomerase